MANYYFIAGLLLIVLSILLVFRHKNKKIKQAHSIKTAGLDMALSLHKTQLQFRQKSLNRYDFLRYNLEEALVVQPEIKMHQPY
ncbi:MAG: hypothetical protein ABJM06_14110 [Gilvibacter sp.]